MSEDVYENFPMGFFKRIKSARVSYDKMSNLAKREYEARLAGMSYGRYMALREAKSVRIRKVAKNV